jgi:hypothetical protein
LVSAPVVYHDLERVVRANDQRVLMGQLVQWIPWKRTRTIQRIEHSNFCPMDTLKENKNLSTNWTLESFFTTSLLHEVFSIVNYKQLQFVILTQLKLQHMQSNVCNWFEIR